MTTVHGVELVEVNGAPQNIIESFYKAIEIGESARNGANQICKVYEQIGKGACGMVFALSEDFVVKVNRPDSTYECQDGRILEDLQGLPLVPTLYAYSEDNKYTLIQRIKGITVSRLFRGSEFTMNVTDYDRQHWDELNEQFHEGAIAKGWYPNDLHEENCMIDTEGRFWVIDVGLFKRTQRDTFGGNTLEGIRSHLDNVSYFIKQKVLQDTGKNPLFQNSY